MHHPALASEHGTLAYPLRHATRYTYSERIFIDAPPECVWMVLSGLTRWPAWLPTVKSVLPLDCERLALRARYRVTQPGLRSATWQVTEVKHGECFVWETRWLGLRVFARHQLKPSGSGTVVSLEIAFRGALAGISWLLFGFRAEAYVAAEAASLKEEVELEAVGAGGYFDIWAFMFGEAAPC